MLKQKRRATVLEVCAPLGTQLGSGRISSNRLDHFHFRANFYAIVEVDHLFIDHSDAT